MTPTSYLELIGLFTDLVGKKPGPCAAALPFSVSVHELSTLSPKVKSLRLVQAWGADHEAGALHHWLQDAERDQVCCRRSEGKAQLSDTAQTCLEM